MLAMPDGNDGVQENAKAQLTELILQNQHHPSICFWGIQNEIAMMGESLEMYDKVQELNALVKQLDDTRLSTAANLYCVKNNSQLNFITDCIGYNLYYGWYYGEMTDYADFIANFRRDNPGVALGFSEYGVDCSLRYHSAAPKRKDYTEEYQALYHETVYAQMQAEPAVWGTFVWNLFDFGSAIRDEGGVKGRNCKGLVTWDRKTKKDAFYYYKACWTKEPLVYITGRRFAKRDGNATTVKVYSNCPEVTLYVNGTPFATKQGKTVFTFANIPMEGERLELRAVAGDQSDTITIEHVSQPEQSYIYVDPNPEINVKNWFTMQQSEEDLFPADRFSLMDSIGDILDNEQAYALLQKELPQVANDERSKKFRSMGLLRILNRTPNKPSEEELKELNRKLNAIHK
jgi:beta-galactosidase